MNKELIKAINEVLQEWNIEKIISIKENEKSFRITAQTKGGFEVAETIKKENKDE